jgi:REP element-mobilizing transposase RayT
MMLTFVTTTSYGTWFPGDARGWVSDGKILPPSPPLEQYARSLMQAPSVLFTELDQVTLLTAIQTAATEFEYRLWDLSIESWHLHWIIQHEDKIDAMVGRLKTRMRQALQRGRIWTEGYDARILHNQDAVLSVRNYIRRHHGCRISAGILLPPPRPPQPPPR